MRKLEIQDLHVQVGDKEIIKGISLTFEFDKIHALMGPNGSGKSTLANAIVGNPKYKITRGKILLDGEDLTYAKPNVRSKAGLFLSFQYPAEISGVTISTFLRTAVNSKREANGEKKYSVIEFHKLLKNKMSELNMDLSFSRRDLNAGFSGGEKKKAEMLQLAMLEPSFCILDELDSGTDVDAIKIVAQNLNKTTGAKIIITHYNKFLQYLQPDVVSIIYNGKIIKQGGHELAKDIEENGFAEIIE
jgi:Fe-S cluster assembly ATP-binding protein